MSSKTQNLIVVVGATGAQGSSVVRTFLLEQGWRVRGLTRDTRGKRSQELAAKGVEMVTANLDDPTSLESAFDGATAIFAVTDFWGPFTDPANHSKVKPGQTINKWSYEHELQQAKNIFHAAAKIKSLQRFVWSGLSNVEKWSKGKYTWVYHFQSKADATEHLKEGYPELWKETSVIQVGWYASNHSRSPFMQPVKTATGTYKIKGNCPGSTLIPFIVTEEDVGPFVRALVISVPAGKNLIAYRAHISFDEFMRLWSKHTGETGRFRQISYDEMEPGTPIGKEGADNFAYLAEFGYEGRDDPTLVYPKDLGVEVSLPTIEDWIKAGDWSAVVNK